MLDQGLVRSGFDVEILLGERQLTYLLLALVDTGRIPLTVSFGDPPKVLGLRGPDVIDRTYVTDPGVPTLEGISDTRRPFEVQVLFDPGRGADVRIHVVIEFQGAPVEADLFASVALETERDEAGLLSGAALRLTLLDIESVILPFVESQFGIDKATILATLKEQVDRTVDMGGVGAFKRMQDLAFRKLEGEGGGPRALGLYINLRLQKGPAPGDLREARGDLDKARNFLPAGSDLAMATRVGLYGDLAKDAFERFAEEKEGGGFHHPWRKSPFNPRSKQIGKIVGVSVGPQFQGNALRVDVEVEYQVDNFFDPNAHMVLTLTPKTNDRGVFEWGIDADFHASLALEIIGIIALAAIFTGIGALAGFGIAAAVSFGLITGSLADAIGHWVVDELYSGRVEKKADAALPDVLTGRVEVARRRWDPLYTTHHQIAMRPDGAVVNANGVALWGRAVLDRDAVPVDHAVIRDERAQLPSPPTHLRYRVQDFAEHLEDFKALAPATDRRDIGQHDKEGHPDLFELSIGQVEARLAENRIIPNLPLLAKRVDMRQGQVHQILTISQREVTETRNGLIGAFQDATRPQIETDQGPQLRLDAQAEFDAAGVTPTAEELEARVQELIDEALKAETNAFKDGPLDAQLEQALLPLLRFDLPPEHFGALQRKGILHLLELELIRMHAPGHAGFMYYRDHPDFHAPDNLHSRPRYKATPEGPVLL